MPTVRLKIPGIFLRLGLPAALEVVFGALYVRRRSRLAEHGEYEKLAAVVVRFDSFTWILHWSRSEVGWWDPNSWSGRGWARVSILTGDCEGL